MSQTSHKFKSNISHFDYRGQVMLSHMMAVIYTDVGLHLECLPQISRQRSFVYSAELRSQFLTVCLKSFSLSFILYSLSSLFLFQRFKNQNQIIKRIYGTMEPWQYTALTHKFNQLESKLLPERQQQQEQQPAQEPMQVQPLIRLTVDKFRVFRVYSAPLFVDLHLRCFISTEWSRFVAEWLRRLAQDRRFDISVRTSVVKITDHC